MNKKIDQSGLNGYVENYIDTRLAIQANSRSEKIPWNYVSMSSNKRYQL